MAYTYDNLFAVDPNNPMMVAANASITVFDVDDVTKAAVTLTDTTGAPIPNPVTVNNLGFGPKMKHPTLDRLGWEGGGLSGVIISYEGLKEEAVAARQAALAAQNAAEAAANDAAVTAAGLSSTYLTVLVYDGADYPARPVGAPAGLVRYVGPTSPTGALTGDEWLDTSTADTTAPSAVTNLTAGTATATTVPLSWTAATDAVGVAGYEYSTNGTTYTSTGSTGTSYTVTGLTASTAYTFYVRAFDDAGNRGDAATVAKTTASGAVTYDSEVLADAPTAYYRLNEASGATSAADSGSAPVAGTPTSVTFGAAGLVDGTTAASFNGSASIINAGSGRFVSATAITFETVVKLSASAASRSILGEENSFRLYLTGAGVPAVNIKGTAKAATTVLAVGTEYHLAVTYDGTTARIYVNGVEEGNTALTGALPATSAVQFQIGASNSANFTPATIAGVAVYKNAALSAARILAHAQAAAAA